MVACSLLLSVVSGFGVGLEEAGFRAFIAAFSALYAASTSALVAFALFRTALAASRAFLNAAHESLVYADSLSFSASATRPASLEVSTRSSRAAMASFRFW